MNQDSIKKFIASLANAFRTNDPLISTRNLERDNVTTLEIMYKALSAGNHAALGDLMTEDVELEIIGPAVVPFTGKWRGVPQVLDAIQQNFTHVRNQRPEIVNLNAQGNSIVVIAREQGEATRTGKQYDIHWVQIFTFRDGKLSRLHEVADGLDLALAFTG